MNNKPHRGDVYFARLDDTVGSEQAGIRPVVILQNDKGNHYAVTTIAAVLTSQKKHPLPVHVMLRNPLLPKTSCVLTEQIKTISMGRLVRYICTLTPSEMRKIDKALKISLALQ